jgi:hypothetical protein
VQVAASFALVQVKSGRGRYYLCGLRGVERQVGSARWTRWPNEIKCRPHGGKKSKTSRVRFLGLSHKTKVELGRRGGQVMSGIGI